MCFGDLPAQDEADTRTTRFCREERDEKVRGVWDARAVILDPNFEEAVFTPPSDSDAAGGFERSIHGIVEKIDEELLELVRIGMDFDLGAGLELHRQASLES